MIFFKAIVRYGESELTRTFYNIDNAIKWLYSHSIGQYFINGIEYTRETLKDALKKTRSEI